MAGVRDRDLGGVGPWPAGINNVAKESKLPTDDNGRRVALRYGENIDLDAGGWPQRRDGRTRIHASTLAHSLWSDPELPFGLYVDAGELCAIHEDEQRQPLGVMVGNLPVSFARINDRIVWSTETHCGMFTLDLEHHAWAPEQPSGQPTIGLAEGLALDAGQYQVAITFVDALGRESGSTLASAIDVPASHGLLITDLPQPFDAPTINVYVAGPDDQVLRLHGAVPAGVAQVIVGLPANGRVLATQFLEPLPPGDVVRYHHGRQYVASGRELRWSEPLRYGLWNRARNRTLFPVDIDLMEPIGDGTGGAGVFVAAGERTYWLGGAKPEDYTLKVAYAHGAVPRTSMQVDGTVVGLESAGPVLVWLSRNGYFCLGLPGGQVVPLREGQCVADGADSGAILLREREGLQQLVVALKGPRKQSLAVTDRAVAHVLNAGKPL